MSYFVVHLGLVAVGLVFKLNKFYQGACEKWQPLKLQKNSNITAQGYRRVLFMQYYNSLVIFKLFKSITIFLVNFYYVLLGLV